MSTYSTLRDEIEFLGELFECFANAGSGLHHDLISGPDCEPWTQDEFAAFVEANRGIDGVAWEEWQMWSGRDSCSRFWGCSPWSQQQLRFFQQLAARAYRLLVEMTKVEDAPPGFRVDIQSTGPRCFEEAHCGWLALIHEWSYRFPTHELQGQCRWWNSSGLESDAETIAERVLKTADGRPYHAHPICCVMDMDVFTASSSFIRFCLEPDEMIRLGVFDGTPELRFPAEPAIPGWFPNEGRFGQLWFGDELVKEFEKEPEAQATVLATFEEAGWPPEVDNPFFNDRSIDELMAPDCLRNTVESLNERHITDNVIKFGTRDNRTIVTWREA